MFGSVLVPLDGSRFAEQALPLAATIARAARAKLRLVLVHEPSLPPLGQPDERSYVAAELRQRRAEKAYLKGQVDRLRAETGVRATSVTLDGEVVPAIAEQAHLVDGGLVVMTTHGRGPVSRFWLGSVADELVRTLPVPILLVRPEEGEPAPRAATGRIVVPLDGSELGEAALVPAAELAERLDAALMLVHVLEPVPVVGDGAPVYPAAMAAEFIDARRARAEAYLDDTARPLRERGLRVEVAPVVVGSVAEVILDLAHGEDVAFVALSTHGRGGLQRLLLGSVADKVVRAAECPVLVVRPAARRRRR